MAVSGTSITKLEEKKYGIHMSGLTKVLPWLYPAFAVIFLGLNIAGITTGLGSGILGNLPQGAILNGNIWQSIANGAYLLAQGSLVGIGVAGVAGIYPAIRNITSYSRYKKSEKFNFVKNKVVAGVNFDKEIQMTESIINSMLPSSTIGASRMEQALELRNRANLATGLKKIHLTRKAVWQEDVIRRSIVKLTDRLAELTRMENRGWKSYSSKAGYLTLTANEIATRKQEMRMIQDYLAVVLNKFDAKDPFVTTVIAQVKKYRVDKLNDGTKVAGIHLVQETTDPATIAVANEINDKLVKGEVKQAVIQLYNNADNDLASVSFGPTDAVERAIANINLRRSEDAANLAESAADSATQDAYTAHQKLNRITQLEIDANAKVADIETIKNNARIILATLRNTLINARNKKQKINRAYNQATTDLMAIGITKTSAEAVCQEIVNKQAEANTAVDDINNKQVEATNYLTNINNISNQATQILGKLGRQRSAASRILNKLNLNIRAANGNLATIRRNVRDSYDKLTEITQNEEDSAVLVAAITDQNNVARNIIEQILEESERATEVANNTEIQFQRAERFASDAGTNAGKARSHADNAETEYTRTKGYADQSDVLYTQILTINNNLTAVLNDANATKDEIEQAKEDAFASLAGIKIYGKKAEGIVDTIIKNANQSRRLRNETQSNADKSKIAKNTARKSADEARSNASDAKNSADEAKRNAEESSKSARQTKQHEQEARVILNAITNANIKIKRIAQSVKDIQTNVKNKSKTVTEIVAELESEKSALELVVADINGLHATAVSETDSIAKLNNYAHLIIEQIDEQLQKAQKSASQTRSYEQSAQQIRIRMTQLENSSKQILGNINALYYNLKTDKKVATKEIEQAKKDLGNAIAQLTEFIANAQNNTNISVATLQEQLKEAKELLSNITTAEQQAKESLENIKEIAKKFMTEYNRFVDDYNTSYVGFSSLTARLDSIETRLKHGEDVAQELSNLSSTVALLRQELDMLKRNRVTKYQLEKLKTTVRTETIAAIDAINDNIDKLSATIVTISSRIDSLKIIKPVSPEKAELNETLKEIKNWARLICWAVATDVKEIKKTSLGGATRYIKSRISGPSKKTNGSLSYSEDEIIGEALNDFLGTGYEDVSKITDLKEAKALLEKIEQEVENYNASRKPGSTI